MERDNEIKNVNIEEIIPNRFQPRLSFEPEALKELAESIKQYGIFQPLVVRRIGNKYEIIAGERRYKAASQIGVNEVPCIVIDLDDNESAEIALVENLQRRDLTPIEEAKSYKKLLERGYITQDQLAKRMGKSQSALSNKMRLLNLDEEVQQALLETKISERHARSLLSIKNKEDQKSMLEKIISKRMTVKETDMEVKKMNEDNTPDFVPVTNEEIQIEDNEDINVENINIEELEKTSSIPLVNIEKSDEYEEEINDNQEYVDIEKLTKSAEDLNKKEPRRDIMDLLKVEQEPNFDQMMTFSKGEENIQQDEQTNNIELETSIPKVSVEDMPAMDNSTPDFVKFNFEQTENNLELEEQGFEQPIFNNFENIQQEKENTPDFIPITSNQNIENQQVEELTIADDNYQSEFEMPENDDAMINQQVEEPIITNKYMTNTIATAINTIREGVTTLEKYGFSVEKEELDLEDSYQIMVKIAKNR